jgi:hypothetical protein
MPAVMRTRRLRSCHDISEASSPVPRGLIIRRAGRVDRRPLRHLQGARGVLVLPHLVPFTINQRIYRVRAGAFPARALTASGDLQFSSLIGSVVVPRAVHWRSNRRGAPRPCRSVMPGAGISRLPAASCLRQVQAPRPGFGGPPSPPCLRPHIPVRSSPCQPRPTTGAGRITCGCSGLSRACLSALRRRQARASS